MSRNSNQQSCSVNIRAKRQQFRSELRRQYIQDYFAAKRIQLLSQNKKSQVYQKYNILNEKINRVTRDPFEISMIQKAIFQKLNEFPNEICNFLIIGNYMIVNNQRIFQFEKIIFNEGNLQNKCFDGSFVWCAGVYIKILCQMIQNSNHNAQSIESFERTDNYLSILLQKHLNSDLELNQNSIATMNILNQVFSMLLNTKKNEIHFPIMSVRALGYNSNKFYQKISNQKKINVRCLKQKITMNFIDLIQRMRQLSILTAPQQKYTNQHYQLPQSVKQSFTQCASNVFHDNVKDASKYRVSSLESILILCHTEPIISAQYIFVKKNVSEFLYLIANHNTNVAVMLLKCFAYILPAATNFQISLFIELSLHINLVLVLKKSLEDIKDINGKFQEKGSDLLQFTLKVALLFLNKMAQADERMFENVLNKMIMNQFDSCLQFMTNQRYTEDIEKVLSQILDTYFDDDVCKDNNCFEDNRNHGINKHSHYKEIGNNHNFCMQNRNFLNNSNNYLEEQI